MAGLKMITVPMNEVRPNKWNPNRATDRVKAAIRESIEMYGFIDPVTVRKVEDGYEIVDGEHRYEEWLALGESHINVIPLDLTEEAAKKLTVILNETRGEADVVELSFLLQSLEMEREELMKGLPYDDAALDALLLLASSDWHERLAGSTADDALERWTHLRVALPPGVHAIVVQAVDKFYEGRQQDARIEVALGLWIEAMAADYIAGP